MRLTFATWVTSCLLGVCLIQLGLAALPPNGAHELDNFAVQEQQALNPSQSKTAPLHGNRLFNRAIRGPQTNVAAPRLNPLQKSQSAQPKSTSTTAAPVEDDREVEENVAEPQTEDEDSSAQPKEEAASSTTSSTEATRKPLGGVLRPFRSNKDLLDSLKRRRQMQQQHGYTVVPPTSSASSTSEKPYNKSTQSTRKGGNLSHKSGGSFSADQVGVPSQKKSTANRRYNTKTSPIISSTTPLSDAITEESNVVAQPSRSSRTYPKTRRIS